MQLNPKSTIVYFSQINRGSPGERAGIKKGDRLVEINEESVAEISFDYVKELVKLRPGSWILPFLPFQILPSHIAKNLFEHCDKYKKDPHESDKGVVVLLSDPETDQYIQEVSHLSPWRHHYVIIWSSSRYSMDMWSPDASADHKTPRDIRWTSCDQSKIQKLFSKMREKIF